MTKRTLFMLLILALAPGCDWPGQPNPANKFQAPSAVLDFTKLYAKNCAGCHGKSGELGPAPPLGDPVFLAIVSDAELTKTIAGGRKGTSMPAFAKSRGGTLTDAQVQALVKGLRQEWGQSAPSKMEWPAYALPDKKGDKEQGQAAFARACAPCHGQNGAGTPKVGPINDAAFLALASEQMLRRIVITGRPDLGMPDCAAGEGRPLAAREIDDLVALMMSWKE